jgi:tRNA modification GTPase
METLADADLVLVVLDSSVPVTTDDQELLNQVEGRAAIVVQNKMDIASSQIPVLSSRLASVQTSATTSHGIAELRTEILRQVGGGSSNLTGTGFLTNLRHQDLVNKSLAALDAARTAIANKIPHEMLLLDLYSSLRPLDEITGSTTTDDILNLIFSTFCIGK